MSVARIALLAFLVASAGCESIVGVDCAPGYELCGGRCLASCTEEDAGGRLDADALGDAQVDAGDGGDGGTIGDDGGPLDGGDDAGGDDAGGDDAGGDDAGGDDAGGDDGGLDDGALDDAGLDAGLDDAGVVDVDAGDPGDGGPPACDLGEIFCAGACIDGLSDPANCGGCGVTCGPLELCASGMCVPSCAAPRMLCGGVCLDVTRDPDNCGSCGNVCASGICTDGVCSEALAGHVVVIGHDYATSRVGMNRLAGNAVFLSRGSPVDVLVWEGGSTAASRLGTDAAIQQVARAIGRTWTRTVATDAAAVPLLLSSAHAFVIYAQAAGDDASLRALGAMWAVTLDSFVRRGGVVVLFETSTAANAGTWQILDSAGLFRATGRTDTTGSVISVTAPADSVALRVPLSYSGERTTVRFATSEVTVVAADSMGPVVVHRTIVP